MHWWFPLLKLRTRGMVRRMLKSSGFSKTVSSWLAELTIGATMQPAGTFPSLLRVSKRLASQGDDRAIESQAFLERVGGERQVVGEKAHLIRVLEQAIQRQRKRLRRQIIAGDDAELHQGQGFPVGQAVTSFRGVNEVGNQILLGRLAALVYALFEESFHVLRITR